MLTFVLISLGAAAAFYILSPMWSKQHEPFDTTDERTKELERLAKEKQKRYNDIKDLDFEYGIGKMAEVDYQSLRKEAVVEAARLLQRIDAIHAGSNGFSPVTDEYLENLIRSKRKFDAGDGDVIIQTGGQILECPGCHFHNEVTAKFCSECGTRLVKA